MSGSNNEQREAEWLNGDDYEYEFAYCSACGRMQYADWNSHAEAKEKIGEFHNDYKFCPGCGAKMVGGRYYGICGRCGRSNVRSSRHKVAP